jgi:hypothetical protein
VADATSLEAVPPPTARTVDAVHGADLHISTSDTCLRGAANQAAFAPTDIDGQTRPLGVDVGADETG